MPKDSADRSTKPFLEELKAVARPQVLLGLLMTALGFAGVFTVFTYIQPLLMRVSGFAEASVSPILLVFGGGLIVGNLLGGRPRRPSTGSCAHRHARCAGDCACSDDLCAAELSRSRLCSPGCWGSLRSRRFRRCRCGCFSRPGGRGESVASSLEHCGVQSRECAGRVARRARDRSRAGAAVRLRGWRALVTVSGLAVALWSVRLEKTRRASNDSSEPTPSAS